MSRRNSKFEWLRRRRLDGALHRLPEGFYSKVWKLLECCHGICINGRVLPNALTREMAPNEYTFAIQVDQVLTSVPQPEYRQLMVEALMILIMIVEKNIAKEFDHLLELEQIVRGAHEIFLEDQRRNLGKALKCCAERQPIAEGPAGSMAPCGGAMNVCQYFYDSSPSGPQGTMTYLMRAYLTQPDIVIE